MSIPQSQSGFVSSGPAQLYYESAGSGTPLIMVHAGVADSRQWNNEFAFFARDYHVIRYDLRGYGKSEPVEGDFRHLDDLVALLDALGLREPVAIMGCSMGGRLALDFALKYPSRTRALVMVGAGPGGLELDVPVPAKFAEVEKAFEAGDLDLVAELETQIWFDGMGRTPDQVDPEMRRLAYEMDRLALAHEVKQMGKLLPDTGVPAVERLGELTVPVLVVVGAHDTPFALAAADYLVEKTASARKVVIEDAAHLPNMDHPHEFQSVVAGFLASL